MNDDLAQLAMQHNRAELAKQIKWKRLIDEQIAKALDSGLIELVGFDEVGEPLYRGVQK